jgi:hypothetical protein
MGDRTVLLERIETAESATPYCICGAPMSAVAHGAALWLECTASARPRRGLLGFAARLWIHSRLLISEAAVAA